MNKSRFKILTWVVVVLIWCTMGLLALSMTLNETFDNVSFNKLLPTVEITYIAILSIVSALILRFDSVYPKYDIPKYVEPQ